MAKAKAKEYFKNHIYETIRHIQKTFIDTQLHHLMPQSYINEIFDNLKESLDYDLHRLTEEIKDVKYFFILKIIYLKSHLLKPIPLPSVKIASKSRKILIKREKPKSLKRLSLF